MVLSINQCSLQINNRIACQHTLLNTFTEAFFNRREVLLWYCTTKYFFFKYQVFGWPGLKFNPYITKLTMTARLFLMFSFNLDLLLNGFTIWDLRICKFNFNFKLSLQLTKNQINML